MGPNFNQSEAEKHCFLDSDWLTFGTPPPPKKIPIISVIYAARCSGFMYSIFPMLSIISPANSRIYYQVKLYLKISG